MGGKFCGWWCSVLWMCSLGIGWLQAETIHFTNSPKLIMASKNFTTYEIEVPGSKPITIIEATDPYDRGSAGGRPVDTFPKEVQLPNGGPTTSFRTSTGLSVKRPTDDQNTGTSVEQVTGSRKTLYSPELLNKFLKEYSEKLRNADSATRKRLNEITMINNSINRNQNDPPKGTESGDENQYRNKHPHLDAIQAESQNDTGARLPEDEPKTEDEFVFNDTHERHVMSSNKRWYQETAGLGGYQTQTQIQTQQTSHKNHPWNIKDGWVTLEAVPWSESKVSKWHASGAELNKNTPAKFPAMQHALDKYWSAGTVASEETPKYKPIATSGSIGSSSYYNGEADDDYGYGSLHSDNRSPTNRLPSSATPTESLYNRRRPIATLYSDRPDSDRPRPSVPPQPPIDSWYDQQPYTSNPYDSMKAYHDQGSNPPTSSTPNRDIITDGRPANFPKSPQDRPGYQGGYSVDNTPQTERVRPVSYPDRGNGEWVLISTTKGYQYPKRRHGQRAITFSPATSTSHQTVKLTVLPMKNAIDMTTSHNGLIEVSSSSQTVEDAVKQQKSKRKGQYPGTTASSFVSHKKKKHSAVAPALAQTFSLMRRDAAQDSSAVLAAVGAGMVPATMAILAPMVLGRKKK
uniref:Uncharacterized protein n=1 Tax=Anopheles minimus TaxID=112268 RepID=A0A182VWP6_9DIPT